MKAIRLIPGIICTCMLAVVLAACGSSAKGGDNPLSAYAGEYKYYCAEIMGHNVILEEEKDYTTTLTEDGKGSLYWGENNQGPISEWTLDDPATGALTIKAGVASMQSTAKNGILRIVMDDELSVVFALEGADTSGIEIISMEELQDELSKAGGSD